MVEDNNTEEMEKESKHSAPPRPRWLFYLLSLVFPILGIVIGIVYLIKKGKENRKFGIRCLIWSCVNILVIIFWKVVFLSFIFHYFIWSITLQEH